LYNHQHVAYSASPSAAAAPRVLVRQLVSDTTSGFERLHGTAKLAILRLGLSSALALVLSTSATAQLCLGRPALGTAKVDNLTAEIGTVYNAGVTFGDTDFLWTGLAHARFDGGVTNTTVVAVAGRSIPSAKPGLHICPTAGITYLFPVEAAGTSTTAISVQPGISAGYEIDAAPGGVKLMPIASAYFLFSRTATDLGNTGFEGLEGTIIDYGTTAVFEAGVAAFPKESISVVPSLSIPLKGSGGVQFDMQFEVAGHAFTSSSDESTDKAYFDAFEGGILDAVTYIVGSQDRIYEIAGTVLAETAAAEAAKIAAEADEAALSTTVVDVGNVDFSGLTEIERLLEGEGAVNSVEKGLSGDRGTLTVKHLGSADDLLEIIRASLSGKLDVTGFDEGRITLTLKGGTFVRGVKHELESVHPALCCRRWADVVFDSGHLSGDVVGGANGRS